MPDTISPSVPEELRSEIREELWRAHTLLRGGKASLIECLEIVYDAYAKYAFTKALELTPDVLTKEIPEWMAKWVLFLRWPLLPRHQSDDIPDDMMGWSAPPSRASVVLGGMTFGVGDERRTVQLIKSRIFPRIGYWLTRLPQAPPASSAQMDENARPNAVVAPTAAPAKPAKKCPELAAWFRERLDERNWTLFALKEAGGPEHRTAKKILNGDAVRDDVLPRLASALSKHPDFPRVDVRDIPKN